MKIRSSITTVAIILTFVMIYGVSIASNDGASIETVPQTATEKQAEAMHLELNTVSHDLTPATLVRVVDGDTIVVDIDGTEQKVRLIGIDTPESVHPDDSKNTVQGDLASENTKVILENVNTVYLQKDVSDTDRYGRLLRYVWLTPDMNDVMNMLNARLVADGWAVPKTYKPDTAYADTFEAIANGTYD